MAVRAQMNEKNCPSQKSQKFMNGFLLMEKTPVVEWSLKYLPSVHNSNL